jgi:hypothetical protein
MRIILKIIKYILLLGLLFLTASLLKQYQTIYHDLSLAFLWPFIAASCAFAIVYAIWLKRITRFPEVFVHELTHLVFTLLSFNKPRHFSVSSTGGATSYEGKGNWLISLSPYCFPLVPIIFTLVYYFINEHYKPIPKYLIAISYVWYLATIFRYFSFKESDISNSGGFFAILFVISFNVSLTLALVYFLSNNAAGLWNLVRNIVNIWGAT